MDVSLRNGFGGYLETMLRSLPVPPRCHVAVSLVALALLAGGCGSDDDPASRAQDEGSPSSTFTPPSFELVEVGRFEQPVHALPVPGTDLVAVVEQGGRVLVVEDLGCADRGRCPDEPASDGDVVVDLSGEVSDGGEQGLLGMTFHPDWPQDPRIFLNYTDRSGDTRIEAWTMQSPTSSARRDRELLRIDQPFENHNGGHLAFGPDRLLYIGMGDGGSGGDPGDRAQQPDDLLGKLLRIDVDGGGERGYAIPPGNVAADSPVWAIGLRNPWRFSFDSTSGDLWIGDVGQDEREEIDVLPRARLDDGVRPNFEWRLREGTQPFDDSGRTGPGPMVEPVLDYGRTDGCSVTGGVVYRGRLLPDLVGAYVFADFCGDDLRLIDAKQAVTDGQIDSWASRPGLAQVASIAEVQRGELLVLSLDGTIAQVVPS
jgi:hypothetical protein